MITDVWTIIFNYALVLLAFTFGIYYALKVNISPFVPSGNATDADNDYANNDQSFFIDILKTLWWTLLNAESDPDAFPEEGFAGVLTNFLFILYQVVAVIMILNLLIAMMNSTMHKIKDKGLVYWKFERAKIWSRFIQEIQRTQPPFSIIPTIHFSLFFAIFHLHNWFLRIVRKCANSGRVNVTMTRNDDEIDKEFLKRQSCKMDPNEMKRRKNHAILMKRLIGRFLQKEKLR